MQIRNRLVGWLTLAVFATVGGAMVAADPAFAKVDVDKLTVGGEARIRYEIRTNTSFTGQEGVQAGIGGNQKANASYASHRIRVNVGYDLTPDVSFFAQLQDARNWGSEGVAALGTTGIQAVSQTNANQTGVDLHQGYIQVKNVLMPGLSLKAGRQEIIFGDHRLFGNFGWSQVGNSFDAVRLTHSAAMADVDVFWARIFDTEGTAGQAGNNNIVFPVGSAATATNDQDIYGLYVTLKPVKGWTIEPYWFLLSDGRALTGTGASAAAASASLVQAQTQGQTRHTLGGRINGKAGGLDFTYEGAHQFGSIASRCTRLQLTAGNTGQTGICSGRTNRGPTTGTRDLHVNAHAHAVRTGYTFDAVPMKPRLGFEFDFASGDNDNNKTNSGTSQGDQGNFNTFDNLFPTNHFHYGYMDLMAWRNMVNYMIVFDVKPSPVSKLQFNFIWHRLANAKDNWYRAGQAVYAVSNQFNQAASLGQELDIHYWHTFKEKFKFEIGYGHFFTGEYIEKTLTNINGNNLRSRQGAVTLNGNAILAGANADINDQNWGYVMGSILF